jgi:thiol-disulfide isomerase/thioredoxin
MKSPHQMLCASLVLLLFACSSPRAEDQAVHAAPHQTDDILTTPFNLADYKGSSVIIAFVSHYCKECDKTLVTLNKLNDKYSASGVKLAGIYVDKKINQDKIKAFIDQQKIHFPLYINNQDLARRYKITFIPTILFFDKTGRLVQKHIGHKKEKVLEDSFIKAHNNI